MKFKPFLKYNQSIRINIILSQFCISCLLKMKMLATPDWYCQIT